MNRFETIDVKTKKFADNHNAIIHTSGLRYWFGRAEVPSDKIQERRIQWLDGTIGKVVHILPNFSARDIHVPSWNFEIYAYHQTEKSDSNTSDFLTWSKYLRMNISFIEIENNIDSLLTMSNKYLDSIELKDLRAERKK